MKPNVILPVLMSTLITVSCASDPKPGKPEAIAAQTELPPAPIPVPIPTPKSSQVPEKPTAKTAPTPVKSEPVERTWTLRKGKLHGPDALVPSKKISTIKNPKGHGTTSEICWNYGKFAIVEVHSTDEKGALDLFVRRPSEKDKDLCHTDFNGKSRGLSVLEGSFAGVAGDYVVVDGVDASEGLTEFQIFSLETGKEAFRGAHHPSEEFSLTKHGERTSLVFFAKLKVNCEMATDPKGCWPKVLEVNGIKKSFPAPDCAKAFKASKTPLEELALITTRARVANLKEPKVELLGGRATCSPAP